MLVKAIDLQAGQRISLDQIETAAKCWSKLYFARYGRTIALATTARFIGGNTIRWLDFISRYEQPRTSCHPHEAEVAEFARVRLEVHGWSTVSVRNYCYAVNDFFGLVEAIQCIAVCSPTVRD